MFLNQTLKRLQEAKSRLVICCELRRQLVHLELHGIRRGTVNTGSNLAVGLSVIELVLGFLRQWKGNRDE